MIFSDLYTKNNFHAQTRGYTETYTKLYRDPHEAIERPTRSYTETHTKLYRDLHEVIQKYTRSYRETYRRLYSDLCKTTVMDSSLKI